MGERCPQCGHRFASGNASGSSSVGVSSHPPHAGQFDDLGIVPDIGVGASGAGDGTSQAEKSQRSRLLKWAAALAALVVAAVFAITSIFGSDRGDQAVADETNELDGGRSETEVNDTGTTSGDPEGSGPAGSASQGDDSLIAGGDPNFPPSDEHLAADAIGQIFQDEINGDDSYAVAYHSQRGLQILSARGASSPELEVAVGFDQAARYPLLSDGNQTWAINSLTPELAYLVSTQFVVVDVGLEGSVAFINNSLDPINVGISSFGAWGPGFNVPKDAEILAVPGRGILIAAATGGTFRLTQFGVVKISDDRIVAAGLNSQVFQRCDNELNCELYVTSELTDGEFVLDVLSTAQVYVSPNGRYVLSADGDSATMTSVETGESWIVELSVPATGAAWAPDGEFVAVIAGESMVFAFIDQSQVAMTMPILPASDAVLVLDS